MSRDAAAKRKKFCLSYRILPPVLIYLRKKGGVFLELSKKTLRRIFAGVAGCIILYWLLHETERVQGFLAILRRLFAPFVVGAALAFVLNVPMRGIERLLKPIQRPGLRRSLALVLTLVAVVLVLTAVIWLLVPTLEETIASLLTALPDFFTRLQSTVMDFLRERPEILNWLTENTDFASLNWAEIVRNVVNVAGNSLSAMMTSLISAVGSISSGIVNFIISLVFSVYCLSRKEILARQGRRVLYCILPEAHCDEIVRILRLANTTFSSFISGQCLEAVILGCMFAVTMLIFRMPYIPLVSILIAVTALIPLVGAFVGCVLGAFFILVSNPLQALWFVVMFQVLQQIENNLIYPRVVGTSIGLPGMWVLVAVTVGGDLMGVGGMLLMIPLASVLYALAREYTDKRLQKLGIPQEKLNDQPPELRSRFQGKRPPREKKKKNSKQS